MNKTTIISITVIIIIVLAIAFVAFKQEQKPGKYDELALCIKDSGAIFYGAFWCPHCNNQKDMFGKSAKLLPYVECSTPDSRSQLTICKENEIEGYPTWEFADGERLSGEVSLETLAEKTGCKLPE